jgi:hypothetical protein
VEVNISGPIRVDIGGELRPDIARYHFDGSPFSGILYLNDTLTDKDFGEYNLRIVSIEDSTYGLTEFYADPIKAIVDRVSIEMSISDDRIDVGTRPEIAIDGYYEYDNSPFQGVITINHPPDYESVRLYEYTICCITDPDYGLESFTSNSVNCIWDQIKITEGGVSQSNTVPESTETIWFKVQYEYDGNQFSDENGILWINDEEATWNNEDERWEISQTQEQDATIEYEVTGVEDEQYGLTRINHAASFQSITWETPEPEPSGGIPGFPLFSIVLASVIFMFLHRRNIFYSHM